MKNLDRASGFSSRVLRSCRADTEDKGLLAWAKGEEVAQRAFPPPSLFLSLLPSLPTSLLPSLLPSGALGEVLLTSNLVLTQHFELCISF